MCCTGGAQLSAMSVGRRGVMTSRIVRWLKLVAWLPIALVLGGIGSHALGSLIGVWHEYIGAILLPVTGLTGAWHIAPDHKGAVCVAFYTVGILLAYDLYFPSYYPEGHPHGYESTYRPFILTLAVSTALLLGFLSLSLRRTRRHAAS